LLPCLLTAWPYGNKSLGKAPQFLDARGLKFNPMVTMMFILGFVSRRGAFALSFSLVFSLSFVQHLYAQENAAGTAISAEGLYRQGTELVYASNVVTDETAQGIALLEQAADAGSVDALLQLGSLNLYGQLIPRDWDKSKGYFERAAAAGNWSGMAEYGAMLMWTERDWRTGQKLMIEAAENGVTSAWVTLASGAMYGYLGGGQHSRAKFDGFAERARAAGEPKIAVLEAERYQWGISVEASGREVINILKAAADSGNPVAAWALVNLLRDGNGQNVIRNRSAAREAMATYAPLFSDVQNWQLDRALQASEARSPEDFAALADLILSRGDLVTKDFGTLILRANPNAAIYVLQEKLTVVGADLGKPDGFAGPKTLAAMYDACIRVALPAWCDDDVMREDVIAAIFTLR
jgi:uncharacterized protein